MSEHLRTNLIALGVILVSLALLAVVVVLLPLQEVTEDDVIPVVEQGETVTMGKYEFTLTKSAEFEGLGYGSDGNDTPIGSALVGAVFEIEPLAGATEDDGICEAQLSSRSTGVERLWEAVDNPEDFNYGIGEERTDFCILEGEPIEFEVVFLTPLGAYEDATVDVSVRGESFRFELVH